MSIRYQNAKGFTRFSWWQALCGLSLIVLFFALTAPRAQGSMTLLLEEPYGGLGHVNPTGHTAIYLDHVCPATPLKLRPCRPGELGVVISRYNGVGHYDWLAIPLIPYLYAVESPSEIPDSMDRATLTRLRDVYRRRHLEEVAPDQQNGKMPDGNWYELVGSAYDRTSYGFSVATSPDQDADLMAIFNDQRNVDRYNAAFRNCADFVRVTVNRIYPHAIRRNFIADFGVSTPKSVARALSHYASKHPQAGMKMFVIPQVEGSLPRSHGVEGITEGLFKRYGIPLVILSPIATAIVFVAYMGHGRFDMPRDAPVLDLREPDFALAKYTVMAVNAHEPSEAPVLGGEGAHLDDPPPDSSAQATGSDSIQTSPSDSSLVGGYASVGEN